METKGHDRILSLDAFRGAAIVLMAVGDFLSGVRWVPAALKHAPDPGITVADLVAPMFLVAMAFTLRPSLARKSAALGRPAAMGRMALRALALIGLGAIFSAGQAMGGQTDAILAWGLLQTLGAASLLALGLLERPAWVRLLAAAASFALFQFLSDRFFLDTIRRSLHNGLVGVLSWVGLLLLSSVVADLCVRFPAYRARALVLFGTGATAAGLGLALSLWIPISKSRASPSYMLVGLAVSLGVFGLFHLVQEAKPGRFPQLRRIGRNPLALYIAHLLLIALLLALPWDIGYAGAPVWLSALQAAGLVLALLGIATILEKRGIVVRL